MYAPYIDAALMHILKTMPDNTFIGKRPTPSKGQACECIVDLPWRTDPHGRSLRSALETSPRLVRATLQSVAAAPADTQAVAHAVYKTLGLELGITQSECLIVIALFEFLEMLLGIKLRLHVRTIGEIDIMEGTQALCKAFVYHEGPWEDVNQ